MVSSLRTCQPITAACFTVICHLLSKRLCCALCATCPHTLHRFSSLSPNSQTNDCRWEGWFRSIPHRRETRHGGLRWAWAGRGRWMNSPGHRRISPLCSFLSPVPPCKRMFSLLGRLGSSLFSPQTSPHAASGFRLGEHGSGQWPHQISFIVCQLNLGKIAARFNSSERRNLAVKSVIQSTELWKWDRGAC